MSRSVAASLTPDRPIAVVEEIVVASGRFLDPTEEIVVASGGLFMLVDEFACTSKSCAPPPVGTGGSVRAGVGVVGPAVKTQSVKKVKVRSETTMDRSSVPDKFWNGKMTEAAKKSGMVPESVASGDEVVGHFAGNIRKMYQVIDEHGNTITREMINASEHWYPAAGEIAAERGKEYGFSTEASAAVLAVLSPGHDWDSNIREHEIVMRVVKNNRPIDAKGLASVMQSIYEGQLKTAKTDESRANVRAKMAALPDLLARCDGKAFNSLSVEDRARLLKGHAMLTEGADAFTKQKWSLDEQGHAYPDGLRYTLDGKPSGISFQTEGAWADAFRILDADKGSDSELQSAISNGLGEGAKVRSFFNNIMYPNSPQRDVTIDTHATSVVVGRRVAQTSVEYKQMSGGAREGAFAGPYVAGVEAYRKVADERGIRPRAAQSQTWVTQKGINDALDGSPTTESLREKVSSKNFSSLPKEAQDYLRKELEIREAWLSMYNSAKEAGIQL